MKMKRCGHCGEEKPLREFHRNGRKGRHPWCRTCKAEADRFAAERKRRYSEKNRARCLTCGGPMGLGSLRPDDKSGYQCERCRREELRREGHDRTERMLLLRRAGKSNEEIARIEGGLQAHNVANILQIARVRRYPDLVPLHVKAPYLTDRKAARRESSRS